MNDRAAFLAHPAFRSGIGVAIGYGAILGLLLVTIYLVPYAIFRFV